VGTTFFVQIPLVLIEKSRTRPLRILVADDVEDNRLLIQLYLKQQSYHLDFAADGLQVLDLFSKNKYDLILLDVHMPHLSGYQAVEQIRRAEKNRNISRTPILALTANAMKEDVIRSIEAGCDRHLTKPITRDMLQRAIVESVTPLPGDHPIDPHPTLLLKKDLAPLIPAFLENRKRELERLGNSIQSKNFDEIHDIGHMIKGVAGTFGFRELSDLCRDLQIHAKAQNLPELEAIHARAKNYLEEVRIHFT
jgi:CheY-like chemotaxis protein/HPt (histidine-containing phosphotransfer) domain-containing protein